MHTCTVINFLEYKKNPDCPENYIISKRTVETEEPKKRTRNDVINDIIIQSEYLCTYLSTKETDAKTFSMMVNLS